MNFTSETPKWLKTVLCRVELLLDVYLQLVKLHSSPGSGNILSISAINECQMASLKLCCQPTLAFSSYSSNNIEIMPEIAKETSVKLPNQ